VSSLSTLRLFGTRNLLQGYLRQVLGFIGITDLDIILAGRPRAGANGETAVKQFGETVALAAAA
jgi:FMN-dependent NADH-azoreductase